MPVNVVGPFLVCILVLGFTFYVYKKFSEESSSDTDNCWHGSGHAGYGGTNYSNPSNNHDHLKHKHTTKEEAEAEVSRMKRCGYDDSHRLRVYYNPELHGWFVGRS